SKGSDDDKKSGSGTLNGLKLRYERFVEAFLANGGNATKAAQYAGYDQTPSSLRAHASRILKKPQVQACIRNRLHEGFAVQTDEVVGVLANRMRGNLIDVLDENGRVDLAAIRELALGHMIEKITVVNHAPARSRGAGGDQTPEPDQTVRLHLNSHAQAANQIARIIRGENPNARLNQALRLVYKMQDALVYFADELRRSEPELSDEE